MHTQDPRGDITNHLMRWKDGDREAFAAAVVLGYDELRAIARRFLRRESCGHTLQATALVNELYLRLAPQRGIPVKDREHFFCLAAMMMRRILTDYARRSNARKRPGAESERVPLHAEIAWVNASGEDMLALDQAMVQLEAIDERAARILELRFFLGSTSEEAAELLHLSKATVARDLEFGKTWLYGRLHPEAVETPNAGNKKK